MYNWLGVTNMEFNEKYQIRSELENINAIGDRMTLDNMFLASLLSEEKGVEQVLEESGFFLHNENKLIFLESIETIKAEIEKMIKEL